MSNPYRWNTARPERLISRTALHGELVEGLQRGQSFIVLGGRGMGKTVMVHHLQRELEGREGVKVLRMSEPPAQRDRQAALQDLSRKLGISERQGFSTAEELFESFFLSYPGKVVLLYDEVDQYADSPQFGRDIFNSLEYARQCFPDRLGVLLTGSLGLFLIGDWKLGSPFLSRAEKLYLRPFDEAELSALAEPLLGRARATEEEGRLLLHGLRLLTGGHPALATYGLQRLWQESEGATLPAPEVLESIFKRFRREHDEFMRSFRRGVGQGIGTEGPDQIWSYLKRHDPPYAREGLLSCLRDPQAGDVELDRALEILEASGLIHVEGRRADLQIRLISSILNLDSSFRGPTQHSLQLQLRADLHRILRGLLRWSIDFFHGRKASRELIPEGAFSALLGIALQEAGWGRVEREAVQVSGRVDLKLAHPSHPGQHAIIEVKIWPRNDYEEIHGQLAGYRVADTTASAAVMIAASDVSAEDYRARCLKGKDIRPLPESTSQLTVFGLSEGTPTDATDHFLICVQRR